MSIFDDHNQNPKSFTAQHYGPYRLRYQLNIPNLVEHHYHHHLPSNVYEMIIL